MLVAFGEAGFRLVEVPTLLCDLTQDGQGTTDAVMILAPLRTVEDLARNSLRLLRLSSSQQDISEGVQHICAGSEEDALRAALPAQRQQAFEHALSLAYLDLAKPTSPEKARQS